MSDSLIVFIDDPKLKEFLEDEARVQSVKPDELVEKALLYCKQLNLFKNLADPQKGMTPEQWGKYELKSDG